MDTTTATTATTANTQEKNVKIVLTLPLGFGIPKGYDLEALRTELTDLAMTRILTPAAPVVVKVKKSDWTIKDLPKIASEVDYKDMKGVMERELPKYPASTIKSKIESLRPMLQRAFDTYDTAKKSGDDARTKSTLDILRKQKAIVLDLLHALPPVK